MTETSSEEYGRKVTKAIDSFSKLPRMTEAQWAEYKKNSLYPEDKK